MNWILGRHSRVVASGLVYFELFDKYMTFSAFVKIKYHLFPLVTEVGPGVKSKLFNKVFKKFNILIFFFFPIWGIYIFVSIVTSFTIANTT